jgi:hypothetical protein
MCHSSHNFIFYNVHLSFFNFAFYNLAFYNMLLLQLCIFDNTFVFLQNCILQLSVLQYVASSTLHSTTWFSTLKRRTKFREVIKPNLHTSVPTYPHTCDIAHVCTYTWVRWHGPVETIPDRETPDLLENDDGLQFSKKMLYVESY